VRGSGLVSRGGVAQSSVWKELIERSASIGLGAAAAGRGGGWLVAAGWVPLDLLPLRERSNRLLFVSWFQLSPLFFLTRLFLQ
jgi:hypothetical protein